MKRKIFLILLVVIAFSLSSCHGKSSTTTKKKTTNAGNQEKNNNENAEKALKLLPVTFIAHVTQEVDGNINLIILPFFDWEVGKGIHMKKIADSTYSATVSLPVNGFIRYVYTRYNPSDTSANWSDFYDRREVFSNEIKINYRVLYLPKWLANSTIDDTIACWADTSCGGARGSISGQVVDGNSNTPITDATVSIGGVFVPTDWEGKFNLNDVPIGKQRITVFTTEGDYHYAVTTVDVSSGGNSNVIFKLTPAKKVQVTFKIAVSDTTLTNVYLVGNTFQLGAMYGPFSNWGFTPWDASRFLIMEKKGSGVYEKSVSLYEGMYIQYLYTLGGQFYGQDMQNYTSHYREVLIPDTDTLILDDGSPDFNGGRKKVTIDIEVPKNTPDGERIFINLNGPSMPLTKLGDNLWEITFFTFPGNFSFYVYHGSYDMAEWEPMETLNSIHSFSVSNDITYQLTIPQWRYAPYANPDSTFTNYNVSVTVVVPYWTPQNASVLLEETDSSGNFNGNSFKLDRTSVNPYILYGDLNLSDTAYYKVCVTNTTHCYSKLFEISPKYDNENFIFAVPWWDSQITKDRNFISSFYPVDYWEPSFLNMVPLTYKRISSHSAKYVVLTTVWTYGDFNIPTIEQRPIRVDNPFTSKEDFFEAAKIAHKSGLKVFVYPQMNMDPYKAFFTSGGTLSDKWFDNWIKCARKLYLYHAWLAEKVGAEILLLPGPFYHVFPKKDTFADPSYIATFNQKMVDLIQQVREIYHGKIVINGNAYSNNGEFYDFPAEADYVMITTSDMGLDLGVISNTATLSEIRSAMENKFQNYIVPMYNHYKKPVIIHFAYPSVDDAANGAENVAFIGPDNPAVKFDPVEQATIFEAALELVYESDYIGGFIDFGYLQSYAPFNKDFSTRDKIAEAVMEKFFLKLR